MSGSSHLAPAWRTIQRSNFTCWQKLAEFLQLNSEAKEKIIECKHFPLNLPRRLADKIEKNNLSDPILKQFLPTVEELVYQDTDLLDPVGDGKAKKCAKLLHKYDARALLITTSACAMHCRYCFRRNFPYDNEDKSFANELELIKKDNSLSEIILSGGDPLSLSNEMLQRLIQALGEIDHVKKIRFHTRFPIGIPERIDEDFLSILSRARAQIIFVIHVNHPKELDDTVLLALKKVMYLGIPILNQSVLLRGVNDCQKVMKELLIKLTDHGVIPYYLHYLDRAQGASHFSTQEDEGIKILQALSSELPGYAIPRYVKEIAGMPSKTPILPSL